RGGEFIIDIQSEPSLGELYFRSKCAAGFTERKVDFDSGSACTPIRFVWRSFHESTEEEIKQCLSLHQSRCRKPRRKARQRWMPVPKHFPKHCAAALGLCGW